MLSEKFRWRRTFSVVVLCALNASCAASRVVSTDPDGTSMPAHMNASALDDAHAQTPQEAPALDGDASRVRVRADAWPMTESAYPWRAVEEGGWMVSSEESAAPWYWVIRSREPSVWAEGVLWEFPAEVPADALPTIVCVKTSPTLREVTRSAWPSIVRLLDDEGIGSFSAAPGDRVALVFARPVRVSMAEISVLQSAGGRRVASGRISLIRGGVDWDALGALRVVLVDAAQDEAPVDVNVLREVLDDSAEGSSDEGRSSDD